MQTEKLLILNEAFNMYNELMNKIKELYNKSEEYIIPTKLELNELLYEAESYMHEVFNCIAHANDVVSAEEHVFMEKLEVYKRARESANADTFINSIFDGVPKYIELANAVDKQAQTDYAPKFIKDTLAICKKLMDIDGNTYADESSFTYSFIDMLEKYIKEN